MPTPETTEKFLTLTELAGRADWSRTTIWRFLGKPDKTYTRRYRRVEVSLYSMRRIEAYNNFAGREYDGAVACKNSNRAFLDRIMVNHIRHELTQHDRQLWIVSGKSGAVSARLEIAQRIFDAIAKAYQGLQDECQRQLHRRMV